MLAITIHIKVSWATLGTWSAGPGQVTATCRSHEAGDTGLVAAGDETGAVSLHRAPACQVTCGRHVYRGHSSDVARLSFLADDTRLVTIGGKDCAILQWEVE